MGSQDLSELLIVDVLDYIVHSADYWNNYSNHY